MHNCRQRITISDSIGWARLLKHIKVAEHSLRAVTGNSRDGSCLRLDQDRTNKHVGKKAMVHRRQFLKIYSLKFCDIWQNFYFYRILNNENFKMEVEQTNFVTHLIITVQLYY